MCCAKSRLFYTVSPNGQGGRNTPVFPYIGLLSFLLSPKTQMKQCFIAKMPDCCLNLLFLPCR